MKLNVDHGGEFRLKSGLRKYACHLTLDPNTANPHLILSEGNRKVTRVEEKQHYEDHPDRFDSLPQVLCREGLSGSRYYWEVERDGDWAYIGVVYKGMKRKGDMEDNRKSWCLFCSDRIPQSCKTCDHVEDSTQWLQIEPLTSTVQGVKMFRHRTPKGRYECTVSGLRWVCERDVILKYHFRNWEPYSQLLKDMQYGQGGPLLDISMELGELEEVHLPHFVCLGTNPSLRNEIKILHVEEHGVSVEEVHEVTRFHAKILHPKFSAISVILSYIFFWNVDVHCDVVLYMAVKKATVISRLYMLLRNSSQKEAVRDREKNQVSQGYSEFLLSSPNRSLKLNSWFAVKNPHSSSINPEKIQLLPADTTPSCCKMVMRNTGVDIEMELIGDDERTVWKSVVSKDEYSKDSHPIALTVPDIPAEEFLKKHWAKLIQRTKTQCQ
ncbi:NACHT, LRR and PYD domains-containing protein 1 homolog [Coregonus clupeaformis]|uniref:NACHT, LRR and PYD domains-containing protein 1 homolog n=1 Tax=Coregonus clupeaformis TaxID=59861 RepID=UPI001E1C2F48|nr:NACHT, LRR and PYD domains-containing protein 1 homolog [Coregonus clupeaformis]